MSIIITGSLARDRIMQFDGEFTAVILPEQLQNLSVGLLLSSMHESWGGVAGNIAYSLGLLQEHPVVLGSIGNDSESRRYIRSLARRGADTSCLHWSSLPTATFSAITDNSQRQFAGFYPGAMSDLPATALEKAVKHLEQLQRWEVRTSIVVVSPHDPVRMASQVADCAQHHWRLVYDIGQQVAIVGPEELRAGIVTAEVVLVNEYELSLLVQKTGWSRDVIARQLQTLVVTLGERGCEVLSNHGQEVIRVPVVSGVNVADPTGAGDAFRAGFFYGLMRDWPAERCARLGNVVAAFAVEHHGTQSHRFSLTQLKKRFEKNYQEKMIFTTV